MIIVTQDRSTTISCDNVWALEIEERQGAGMIQPEYRYGLYITVGNTSYLLGDYHNKGQVEDIMESIVVFYREQRTDIYRMP